MEGKSEFLELSVAMIHEELHWILMITGHTIADGSTGETPEMPNDLRVLSEQFAETPVSDPVTLLFGSVFELIQMETQCVTSVVNQMSPRVAKTIAWYLER